jgi:hypothetical protein
MYRVTVNDIYTFKNCFKIHELCTVMICYGMCLHTSPHSIASKSPWTQISHSRFLWITWHANLVQIWNDTDCRSDVCTIANWGSYSNLTSDNQNFEGSCLNSTSFISAHSLFLLEYNCKYMCICGHCIFQATSNVVILFRQKVKLKLSLCLTKHHAMKAYWGSGGIAPLILWPRH